MIAHNFIYVIHVFITLLDVNVLGDRQFFDVQTEAD